MSRCRSGEVRCRDVRSNGASLLFKRRGAHLEGDAREAAERLAGAQHLGRDRGRIVDQEGSLLHQSGPLTSAFIEHKDVLGLKVRAQLANLTGQQRQYREIFWVDRRAAPVDFTRDGRFGAEMAYSLTVSGTF